MKQEIFKYLKGYSVQPYKVNRLIISAYISVKNLQVKNNKLLKSHLIPESKKKEYDRLQAFITIIKGSKALVTIESLIELFEFVISPADKDVNGAVYTPKRIRNYIVQATIEKLEQNQIPMSKAFYGDISCGCGGFFYTIAEIIHKKTGKGFYEIYKENIYGLDIKEYSIERAKLLLSILALENGEDKSFDFNLFKGDALKFDWFVKCAPINKNGGFEAIVGNPPYVGAVKMNNKTKKLLKKWKVASCGKADLFIPFFQIGIELLKEKGVLGFISVNSFYKSLNGRGLREYFSENNFHIRLVDFAGEQVFKGRTTYTCICIIQKIESGQVCYAKSGSTEIMMLDNSDFVCVNYKDLNNIDGWLLKGDRTGSIIKKIESTGSPLGKMFEIRNGFATLRNNIYVFTPDEGQGHYYSIKRDNREYLIEKAICRDVIKPNILKSESEIEDKIEKIIFPYKVLRSSDNGLAKTKIELIHSKTFKNLFPKAFNYLKTHSSELKKRDKGNKEYEAWYAYGRNQGLALRGKKLLFPYIAEQPLFVYTDREDLLFYNGFAIISDNERELLVLQKVLNSRLFWFYVSHTSRHYENDYYSMGKRYIRNFGIYQFSEKEKSELLNLVDQELIDEFLERIYLVKIPKTYAIANESVLKVAEPV